MAMNEYSLTDLAAVSGNGFGGNNSWLFIILFVLLFAGNGWGNNWNRGGDYGATAASQQDILYSSKFQALDNKIDRIGNGIADATYALNNAVTGEGRGIQSQLANSSCENQKNIDALRFDMSNYSAATQAAVRAEGEATRAMIQQNKIEALQQKVSALEMQNALCGVVKYPMSSSWAMNGNPFCGCNNGCGGF